MLPISFDKKNEDGGGMYRLLYNYDMSLGVYSNIGGASETNFPFGALWDAYRDWSCVNNCIFYPFFCPMKRK